MSFDFNKLAFFFIAILVFLAGIIFDHSIVGYLITLGFAVYAFISPKNGLLLLFLYYTIRPFIIEFNPALKLVGDFAILLLLLKVLYTTRNDWKSWFRFSLFEYGYFAFLAVGVISAFLTGVTLEGIILQLRAFVLFYLVYYIAKRINITKEDVNKFLWTILMITLLLCIHGLIEKLSLRGWLLPESWANMPLSAVNRIRIYGLLGNPNSLGIFLSIVLVPILYLRSHLTGKMVWFMNISLVIMMGVWFMTYSRGTWIAIVVAIAVYVLITKNWRVLKPLVTTFLLGILLVVLPVNLITNFIEDSNFGQEKREVQKQYDEREGGFSERMGSTFEEQEIENSRRDGRLFIVTKGFEIFTDHPIAGTGFGTFGDSATLNLGSPIYDDYDLNREFYSDNQYIQIIVQTGTLGVIAFAVFLLHMLYLLFKERNANPLAPAMITILIGASFACMVYNLWENDVFTLFYFLLLAVALNTRNEKIEKLL